MRQAGRALPEYRALRTRYSFLQLVRTPELAAEVTLQPIRRFGFDAAILFSDILIANEGIGQGYRFRDEGGIAMDFAIESREDLQRLHVSELRQRLHYLGALVRLLRDALGQKTALLGFAGAPWTLANFAVEGGSTETWHSAKRLWFEDPSFYHDLMDVLTDAVTEVLLLQIEAGVDAVQIFDSLAGELPPQLYARAAAPWLHRVVAAVASRVPVILFARGYYGNWSLLTAMGARVLAFDWQVDLPYVASQLPRQLAVQGNLDPFLLTVHPTIVQEQTRQLLDAMAGRPGYIFNLGHGVPPEARLDALEALVQTVQSVAPSSKPARLSP